MDDAGLHPRLREDGLDRLGEPLQPVDAGDQDVLDAALLQVVEDLEPELARWFLEPHPEHVPVTVEGDAQGEVADPALHAACFSDLDHEAVEEDDLVDVLQRPLLPGTHVLHDRVGDAADQVAADSHLLELRCRVQLRQTIADERRAWLQRIHAQLFHHGIAAGGELAKPAKRDCHDWVDIFGAGVVRSRVSGWLSILRDRSGRAACGVVRKSVHCWTTWSRRIRRGEGRSLLLQGEAGIGKTALLEHLVASASDLTVVRAGAVELEMKMDYAGLQQLCGPLLDLLEKLPAPQRQAIEVVFGLSCR